MKKKTKHCPRCADDKPVGQFAPNPSRPDGRSSWCRSCEAQAKRTKRAESSARVSSLLEALVGELRRLGVDKLAIDLSRGRASIELQPAEKET